eukprot:gene10529-12298_t
MTNLANVTQECWFHIATYLSYEDVLEVTSTCRSLALHCIDSVFWENFLKDNFVPATLRASIGSIENARRIVSKIVYHLFQEDQLNNVMISTVCTSSIDQPEEVPIHTLKKSQCLVTLRKAAKDGRIGSNNENMAQFGYFAQFRCGCSGGVPCYYSSASSPDPNITEYITYRLCNRPMVIYGFTITPFQAFFHPGAPVSAPQEVCIQFLKTDSSSSSSANNAIRRLTTEQLEEGVYYQSPYFTVEATSSEQLFSLPSPTLCIGATVRVLFRNMRQRQTLGPIYGEDYYMCISHCAVLAAPIELKLSENISSGRSRLLLSGDGDSEEQEDEAFPVKPYDLQVDQEDVVLCPDFVAKHCPSF